MAIVIMTRSEDALFVHNEDGSKTRYVTLQFAHEYQLRGIVQRRKYLVSDRRMKGADYITLAGMRNCRITGDTARYNVGKQYEDIGTYSFCLDSLKEIFKVEGAPKRIYFKRLNHAA